MTNDSREETDQRQEPARIETLVADAGGRLDRVLAVGIPGLSRSRLKALILAGEVAIGGRTISDPDHRVNADDRLTVNIPPPEPAEPAAEAIPLNVVFEDDALIVIDKPKGLVVHPAAGNWTGTLVNALIAHCGTSLSGVGGVRRPGIVHRLDKDTTGLMVVAKTDRAHQALSRQFADHGRTGPLRRGYLAFVWGGPDQPRGTIDRPIDRHPQARDKMAVREGGREAVTQWLVLERYRGEGGKAGAGKGAAAQAVGSLLECRLETGRTHQIRVHMAHIGHPLMGDETYGPGFKTKSSLLTAESRQALEKLGRQALHAYLLGIEHPETGEALEFRSELPADMAGLRQSLTSGGTLCKI
ncbi:MAG TPA: RluA family pseudouridine synthase [Xanthobacteraceae bacterium]|nr:RluA family pseudouridine synthase [Xanthobacteraceae bacterium]